MEIHNRVDFDVGGSTEHDDHLINPVVVHPTNTLACLAPTPISVNVEFSHYARNRNKRLGTQLPASDASRAYPKRGLSNCHTSTNPTTHLSR